MTPSRLLPRGSLLSGNAKLFSPLDEVLANPSGRRLWREVLQKEIARETTTPYRHEQPPSTGERGGCSMGEGPTRDNSGRPPSTRPSETAGDGPSSPTQEAEATPPTGRGQETERPPTASSKGEERDEQLSLAGSPRPTNLREPSPCAGTGASETAINDRERGEAMSNSPVTVAKLHLALEGLARPGAGEWAGRLDSSECARFCAEWPRDCQIPTFFDRTLLEPAWLAAEQVTFRK